jgi:hypothetical protein
VDAVAGATLGEEEQTEVGKAAWVAAAKAVDGKLKEAHAADPAAYAKAKAAVAAAVDNTDEMDGLAHSQPDPLRVGAEAAAVVQQLGGHEAQAVELAAKEAEKQAQRDGESLSQLVDAAAAAAAKAAAMYVR